MKHQRERKELQTLSLVLRRTESNLYLWHFRALQINLWLCITSVGQEKTELCLWYFITSFRERWARGWADEQRQQPRAAPASLLLLLQVIPAQLTRTEPSHGQQNPEDFRVKIPAQKAPAESFKGWWNTGCAAESTAASSPGCEQHCPGEEVSEETQTAQILKNQHSPEPVPLLTAHSEDLGRKNWDQKWGWSFYFRMKGLGKACSLSNTSNAQLRGTSLTEFPSLGDGIWVSPLGHVSLSPWAPEHNVLPNAAPWKATESSWGLLWFYY